MVVGLAIAGFASILIAIHFLKSENVNSCPSSKPVQVSLMPEIKPVLVEIKKEIEIDKPVGEQTDMYESVTDQVKMLYDEANHGLNWTSCSLVNDGPSGVYVAINNWRQPSAPISVGESINIDLKQRYAIKRIYLVCDAGETSTVRLYALK